MDHPLSDLRVIVVDCQTTGANPRRGHLLEAAWYAFLPSSGVPSDAAISSSLVALPEGASIPRQILRMTGIDEGLMEGALERSEVWSDLVESAIIGGAAVGEQCRPAYAVAHFARFEREFLTHLHAQVDQDTPFPFRFLCTHEIAKRLFPALPRRGLRALAGYFGKPLPEMKRAASHVLATAHVWRSLIELLREERGVGNLGELLHFLDAPPPAGRRRKWSYPLPREKRLGLPDSPGVYRFLGGGGDVLYVGKAASLKSRVNSYFRKKRADDKLLELVSQARDVDVTVTGSALEAALLEVDEIRRLAPAYNRALRDRGQKVWFSSLDLKSTAPEPDSLHALGPLPHEDLFDQVRSLFELLQRYSDRPLPKRGEKKAGRDLGIGARWYEPGAVRDGFKIFSDQYYKESPPANPAALLSLGSELWRIRLIEVEAEKNLAEVVREGEEESDEREGRPIMDGAAVSRYLEGLVTGASRMLRRGRWLTLLAESVVRWNRKGEGEEGWRIPVRQGVPGEITPAQKEESESAGSPGPIDRAGRLAWFDRARYDRLRVLNTELRRLIARGDDVRVHLSTGRGVTGEHLRNLMKMV